MARRVGFNIIFMYYITRDPSIFFHTIVSAEKTITRPLESDPFNWESERWGEGEREGVVKRVNFRARKKMRIFRKREREEKGSGIIIYIAGTDWEMPPQGPEPLFLASFAQLIFSRSTLFYWSPMTTFLLLTFYRRTWKIQPTGQWRHAMTIFKGNSMIYITLETLFTFFSTPSTIFTVDTY